MSVATTKLVLTDNFANNSFSMDPDEAVSYALSILEGELIPEAEPDELSDYQATAAKLGDENTSLSDRVQAALEVLEIVNIYEVESADVLFQQKLSAYLIRIQTSPAVSKDDKTITVHQIAKMITTALFDEARIPADNQRILAVAKWTATHIEHYGDGFTIRVSSAIGLSIVTHVDQLMDNQLLKTVKA